MIAPITPVFNNDLFMNLTASAPFFLLHRWARNVSKWTKHAAVAFERFKQSSAPFTFVVELTGILWHLLIFCVATLWTFDNWFEEHGHSLISTLVKRRSVNPSNITSVKRSNCACSGHSKPAATSCWSATRGFWRNPIRHFMMWPNHPQNPHRQLLFYPVLVDSLWHPYKSQTSF